MSFLTDVQTFTVIETPLILINFYWDYNDMNNTFEIIMCEAQNFRV